MNVQPFSPQQGIAGATQAVLPTATSQSLTFTSAGVNYNVVRIVNRSSLDVAYRVGLASAGAVTATFPIVGTPGDCVIAAGATEVFSKGYPIDTIAIISSGTATGNVYVTTGEGQ